MAMRQMVIFVIAWDARGAICVESGLIVGHFHDTTEAQIAGLTVPGEGDFFARQFDIGVV